MGWMFRIVLLILGLTSVSTIVALNVYADYKQQLPVSVLVLGIAYTAGVWWFKTKFKQNWSFLIMFLCMAFVSLLAYGFGGICLLKQFDLGTMLVENIATYQVVTKQTLNLASGILISILGFFFGMIGVGPAPKEYY